METAKCTGSLLILSANRVMIISAAASAGPTLLTANNWE